MRLLLYALAVVVGASSAAAEDTNPEWIAAAKEMPAKGVAYYRHSFELPQQPTAARLLAAGDGTGIEFYLDGKLLHEIDPYDPLFKADLTEHLSRGKHTLAVRSHSYDPGSMFFLRLRVKFADGTTKIIGTNSDWQVSLNEKDWKPAHERFAVDARLLIPEDRRIDFSATDNIEPWWQTVAEKEEIDPAKFFITPGFQIDLVRSAKEDEGSWISLVFDPEGRAIISQGPTGLIRMTLAKDGGSVETTEQINLNLKEVRGMAFLGKDLYLNENDANTMHRMRPDHTGELGTPKAMVTSHGYTPGRNDLAAGPDGWIYSIHSDSQNHPRDALDYTPAFRGFEELATASDGHLVRFNPVNGHVETLVGGLRNPYGIAFNKDGEAFTYDADAEFDLGTPWYRPTRVSHLTIGSDFGWRAVTKWPPHYCDHPDNSPHNLDIGKGTPTAVMFGTASNFPPRYREALFICDKAYGRILAVHCVPRGASYLCEAETFLKGRLPVMDIAFAQDGSMYLITGGGRMQSALYRVRYTGAPVPDKPLAEEENIRREQATAARTTRRKLEAILMKKEASDAELDFVWSQMASVDPWLRTAAGHVLERQAINRWLPRALAEKDHSAWLSGALQLARTRARNGELIERLNQMDLSSAPRNERLIAAWIYQTNGGRLDKYRKGLAAETRERLSKLYPDRGFSVNKHLSFAALAAGCEDFVPKTLELLTAAREQSEQMHYLFVLSNAPAGWTVAGKESAMKILEDAKNYSGGEGLPAFHSELRRRFEKIKPVEPPVAPDKLGGLPSNITTPRDLFFDARLIEQLVKGDVVSPTSPVPKSSFKNEQTGVSQATAVPQPSPVVRFAPRPFIRAWLLDDAVDATESAMGEADLAKGLRMFEEASCSKCHRCGMHGALLGLDLTTAASRFSRQELLESIIQPSKFVAENYRSLQVITRNGKTCVGRPALGGDYSSEKLRLTVDPAKPFVVTEINKRDIEAARESTVSFMPEGLLNTLTAEDIRDLLAFIEAGGKEK